MQQMKIFFYFLIIWFVSLLGACDQSPQKQDASFSFKITQNDKDIVLENEGFRLSIDTVNGLNPYLLYDKKNDLFLAKGDYYYGFGRPEKIRVEIKKLPGNVRRVSFRGKTRHLLITHSFLFPEEDIWLEENLALKNISDSVIDLSQETLNIRHGFTIVPDDSGVNDQVTTQWKLRTVPYMIDPGSGERRAYLTGNFISDSPKQMGSEGWILSAESSGLLMIKYSQDQLEYSVVSNYQPGTELADGHVERSIIWGGAGIHRNHPELVKHIVPNQTIQFGLNHYTPFSGSWDKGYRLFREFMDTKGHHFPDDFNPPVHWNELFDNSLWWNPPDTPEKRAAFYQFEDMEAEAVKAAEIGCEAIYLDPGWDTRFGSTIWDDERLMTCREFCRVMEGKYNLRVSLHTPLAVWNDQRDYPETALKKFPFKKNQQHYSGAPVPINGDNYLCSGSPEWLRIKLNRLLKLASDGIVYFMFDGSNFTGPCEEKLHGHSIPYTPEEHIRNYAWLAEKIHEKFPGVLIEMHDQILGPTPERYVPHYYTHQSKTFDEIWACEYMWDPFSELVGGKQRARSLYYYNLAYNIPLYLHINLKTDNSNALAFWWYASTCRHLGIGGKYGVRNASPDHVENYGYLGIGKENDPPPEIWEAHKKAMKEYMRLKPFFVSGEFFGIDELTHVHTLAEQNASVIICFNLEEEEINKEFSVCAEEIGLSFSGKWEIEGADHWELTDNGSSFSVNIPARGMRLIKILTE